jgi:hypothetical protein
MSETSQFRQYTEEALCWVREATTEEDKRTLTELACMWALAARQSERIFGTDESARLQAQQPSDRIVAPGRSATGLTPES